MADQIGGIVLCGGGSRRMGQPKAWLPFGEQSTLQRVVDVLGEAVGPIVVVAAPGQSVPPVPKNVEIARDSEEGLGPLAGLTAGLEALANRVEVAYVSSCDVPLLSSAFVETVIEQLGDAEIAIGQDQSHQHPLAAVYRTSLSTRCRRLLSEGRRRLLDLVEVSRSNVFDINQLRSVDPTLRSLQNANTPEEYAAMLELAGLEPAHINAGSSQRSTSQDGTSPATSEDPGCAVSDPTSEHAC